MANEEVVYECSGLDVSIPAAGRVKVQKNGHSAECLMCVCEPLIYDTLCDHLPNDAKAAEIGSFKGGSAVILTNGMKHRGKSATLWCHDVFEPFEVEGQMHDIEAAFDDTIEKFEIRNAVKVKGDSKLTMNTHPDASLDYCFVDGDHSYDGALADIRNAAKKLKPDGWLVVQDCIRDVEQAIRQFASETTETWYSVFVAPPFGHYVIVSNRDERLVDEFDAIHGKRALAVARTLATKDGTPLADTEVIEM